jgi:multiple sugar transport system permease protein
MKSWKRTVESYLFLSPYLVLFAAFYIAPVAIAIGLSLTSFNVLQPPRWLGFSNYLNLFMNDSVFLKAVANTFIYAVVVGPIGLLLSFMFAWLINSTGHRPMVGYTLLFYAPSISGIGMTFIWTLVFSGDRYGILNDILLRVGLLNEPFLWLTSTSSIMPVIIVVSLWMGMSKGFLAQIAGFQSMPTELYEAGRVDGIPSRWHELWYITLPLMKPYILVAAVLQVVESFAVFDIANNLVPFPSPLYAAHTIVTHLWDYAFLRFEMGYSSAIAVVLFVATFGLNRVLVRALGSGEER